MYLKRVEAYGFKSFANRVSIEFEQGMNAIVGPNGSGKSNVVDAVRWVLGEQSAKMLRGGNMQDVIFKGSVSKKQLGFAEVSLILDNVDKILAIEFNEVNITRRLYRNGESLYMINGQKVRLQDVTNLFMDSGIGKESFSIIGQGRIDEILNSKPIDRRTIFEETAGVLKYKTRKEQSLRRLDRTHENLQRVTDIINELEGQVEPLKKQAATATQYLADKEELESMEISLLAYEIKLLNDKHKLITEEEQQLTGELAEQNILLEKFTNELTIIDETIVNIDNEVAGAQEKLLQVTQAAESTKGAQKMQIQKKEHLTEMIEQLNNDTMALEEKIIQVEKLEKNSAKVNFNDKLAAVNSKRGITQTKLVEKIADIEQKRTEKNNAMGNLQAIQARFDTLNEINNSKTNLFQGVRAVVNASKKGAVTGIEGTIVDLVTVDEKYAKALEVAFGNSLQFVVTDSQKDAEQAIAYLKKNRLGRATFLPHDVIQGNGTKRQLQTFSKDTGFIDYAYNLVSYDNKYRQIMLQILGQTIITATLQQANALAKQTNFQYRIVTIDGEIVHRGGSMTGGNARDERTGLLSQKTELERLNKDISALQVSIEEINNALQTEMDKGKALEEAVNEINEKRSQLIQQQQLFEHQLSQMLQQKDEIKQQISDLSTRKAGYKQQLSEISTVEDQLHDFATEHDEIKEQTIKHINTLRTERLALDKQKSDILGEQKASSNTEKTLQKQYQQLEIKLNTTEVRINEKIMRLQENYECSYESVADTELTDAYDIVEARVSTLRKNIQAMGVVNIGAIEEYERVSERYEYLEAQKNDLLAAEDNLLNVINEMDDEMTERFMETFIKIQENFSYTFKKLFGGGNAELKLEQTDNILEAGIEIFAQPPGKKIQNLSLLSGGERALSAIALLFAILKTKPVPFCILDEVEAALDEANVDRFAKFLKTFSEATQFIVVTHRKGTMELADILYGVTMEEAGISKILSVKLQEADQYIDVEA